MTWSELGVPEGPEQRSRPQDLVRSSVGTAVPVFAIPPSPVVHSVFRWAPRCLDGKLRLGQCCVLPKAEPAAQATQSLSGWAGAGERHRPQGTRCSYKTCVLMTQWSGGTGSHMWYPTLVLGAGGPGVQASREGSQPGLGVD